MNIIQSQVDKAIKEVCPIDGVSFGDLTDKTTWSIQFSSSATEDQQKLALSVVDAFDLAVADKPITAADAILDDPAALAALKAALAK